MPGGPGQVAGEKDEAILDWLRTAHETTTWTTSVCTGSLVLGAAGLLEGKRATTYWLALEDLARHGAIPTNERVVFDGKVVTAAGVSSGIDMALTLAREIGGDDLSQMIQLGIEYDPQPPFDSGSEAKAPAHIVAVLPRELAGSSSRAVITSLGASSSSSILRPSPMWSSSTSSGPWPSGRSSLIEAMIETASTRAITPSETNVGMWYHSAMIIFTPTKARITARPVCR